MKNLIKKTFIMMPLLACSLLFTGCFDEEEDDYSPEICNDFEREYNDMLSKANAFSANPSRGSCSAVKQSAIQLMNKVKNCPGGQGAEMVIQQWNNIDCNEF